MALSIGARPGMNNPGDLTVSQGNQELYSGYGQTGVYSSPNGLFYPIFQTAQDGWNALVDYIQSNVGSNDANSLTTPAEFASYYLNGSYSGLSSNSLNPNAQGWLNTFLNALGIPNQPNAQLSQFSTPQIATAVEKAEGTYSTFGNLGGSDVGNSNIIQNEVNAGVSNFGIGATELATDPFGFFSTLGQSFTGANGAISPTSIASGVGTVLSNGAQQTAGTGAQAIGQAVSSGVSSAIQPITNWLGGLTSKDTTTRVVVGFVALLLLAAGIFFLAGNKSTTINLGNVAKLKGAIA